MNTQNFKIKNTIKNGFTFTILIDKLYIVA